MRTNSRAQKWIHIGKKYWYAFGLIFLVVMMVGGIYYYSPWLVENHWFSFKTFGYNLSDCDTRRSSSPFQPNATFYVQNHILYFRYWILSNCATTDSTYHLSYHQFGNEINITGYFIPNGSVDSCLCPFEVSGYIKGLISGSYTIIVFSENELVCTYDIEI